MLHGKKNKWIVGVDEVGRGPLAGRVFVGAVLLLSKQNNALKKCMKNIRPQLSTNHCPLVTKLSDSKKLSERQRNEWFAWVKKNKIPFAVSAASPKIIDRINIARACDRASTRAVFKLIEKYGLKKVNIIADAGITVKPMDGILSYKSFPKADETVPAVSLASIVAKVKRDKEMLRLDKKYPRYGFGVHKGYGTKKHIRAIRKYGPSEIHRLTFIKKYHNMKMSKF